MNIHAFTPRIPPIHLIAHCVDRGLTYQHICNGFFKLRDGTTHDAELNRFVAVTYTSNGTPLVPNRNGGPTNSSNSTNVGPGNSTNAGSSSSTNVGPSSSRISLLLTTGFLLIVLLPILLFYFGILVCPISLDLPYVSLFSYL